MQLHQRGVGLLVDVMDAADHVEQLTHDEIRRLLNEVADVMSLILERGAKQARPAEASGALLLDGDIGLDQGGGRPVSE